MRALSRVPALALLILSSAACSDTGDPLAIDATAPLTAIAFVDRNGNNEVDEGLDLAAAGIRLAVLQASGDTVSTAVTNAAGVAEFPALPVGTYTLGISPTELGDSLRVLPDDSARFTVTAAGAPVQTIALGYPTATAEQVRRLPAGRPVTVDGIALHNSNVFGDLTLHVVDSTGVTRVVGGPANVQVAVGDSVRVLGRVGTLAEHPALLEAFAVVTGSAAAPAPVVVTTARAADAGDGSLDGALVQVVDTRVLSITAIGGGDVRLRVTDGSEPLDVILDRDADISSEDPIVPGVKLDVTGILFPKTGTAAAWVLKPRSSADLVVTVPEATVAEARALAPGSLVSIDAVALNGQSAYGDNTVHIADVTGAIRTLGVTSSFLFAGVSVRVLGIVHVFDGQPVVSVADVTVLGDGTIPPPSLINTQVAETANEGTLDAALVEVREAVVDTVVTGANVVLRVNDGSGPLIVVIDQDTGIGAGGIEVGDRVDVVGLLVPAGAGSWLLKPRSPADLTRR